MDTANENKRSRLNGLVEDFLSDGGEIVQVPNGRTGMTKYLKKLESAKEAAAQAKKPGS